MAGNNSKSDEFDLSLFDGDVDLDNPFADDLTPQKQKAPSVIPPVRKTTEERPPGEPAGEDADMFGFDESPRSAGDGPRRRSSKDFNPDMDALLLTAQSSMIIEGMKLYTQGNFASTTLAVYLEALSGVSLYIKILDRNPNNYNKLKVLFDSDLECREVESTAFNLYQKLYNAMPETDQEKLTAFEKFESLFKEAVNKASISGSMKILKKYLLISGSLDEVKMKECARTGGNEFLSDINNFIQHLQLALDLLNKGKGEITRGLKGRDMNIYIIKTSYLLYYYYTLTGNGQMSAYYARLYNNYKKYFIIRE
jgi:hypothetical protein